MVIQALVANFDQLLLANNGGPAFTCQSYFLIIDSFIFRAIIFACFKLYFCTIPDWIKFIGIIKILKRERCISRKRADQIKVGFTIHMNLIRKVVHTDFMVITTA